MNLSDLRFGLQGFTYRATYIESVTMGQSRKFKLMHKSNHTSSHQQSLLSILLSIHQWVAVSQLSSCHTSVPTVWATHTVPEVTLLTHYLPLTSSSSGGLVNFLFPQRSDHVYVQSEQWSVPVESVVTPWSRPSARHTEPLFWHLPNQDSDRLQKHEYGYTLFQDECLSRWALLTPSFNIFSFVGTSPFFFSFSCFQVFLDPLQTVILAQTENAVTSWSEKSVFLYGICVSTVFLRSGVSLSASWICTLRVLLDVDSICVYFCTCRPSQLTPWCSVQRSTIPRAFRSPRKVLKSSGLVKISASWFSDGTCSITINFCSTSSLTKWCRRSTCLVRECCTGFLVRLIALMLSQWTSIESERYP